MSGFLEILVNTLALGSLYALIALGYTLVYGVLRFINFAHSDVVTWGAWIGLTVATSIGWAATTAPWFGLPAVMLIAMAVCGVMGFAIETLAYRPLRRAPRLNVLITAIGVSLLLQNLGQLHDVHVVGLDVSLFGTQPGDIKGLVSNEPLFHVGQLAVPTVDVVVVVTALVLVLALQWLIYRTRLGQAMRAVSFDERVASLMGHQLAGQRAAALCRHRPHQGAPARCADHRRVRHDADLPRQPVRERLQQVRPHVLGAGAGRRRLPGPR